jgi:glycosyltransferase WbpL
MPLRVMTILAVFVASAVMTLLVRRFALSHGVMDIPNARSSHTRATPRGGGLSIVVACAVALVVFAALGTVQLRLAVALLGGGALVAGIGFLDDRRHMPATLRLGVHLVAAVWAVGWLGGLPALRVGADVYSSGVWGYILGVLGIIWTLNLFNFMDGIDGIAASEAVFIAAGVICVTARSISTGVCAVAAVFGAASAGFLFWNWPPAKIFMGDVGSGFSGYLIAVLAMAATRDDPVAAWVWLILGGAFFVDATVTLARRLIRREPLHQAHRSHAYQWLARRWGGHRPVTLAVIAVNVLWLLPAAWLAERYPDRALWILAAAFTPLVFLALLAGSGRQEPAGRCNGIS